MKRSHGTGAFIIVSRGFPRQAVSVASMEAWCKRTGTERGMYSAIKIFPVITSNLQVTQTCLYSFTIASPFSTATRGLETRLCQPRGIKNTEPESGPAGARADRNSEVSEELTHMCRLRHHGRPFRRANVLLPMKYTAVLAVCH